METFLVFVPFVVVILLLVLRQHMLIAGAAGGLLAMLIGKLSPATATPIFLGAIHDSVGVEIPIIYSAIGGMLYHVGSFQAGIDLCRRNMNERHRVSVAVFLVLLHGCLTYMIGIGVISTFLIAPVLFAIVGRVPHIIAALSITSAVGFCTSPASPETLITANIANRNVLEHAAAMLPYTVFFYCLASLLAAYGVWKQGSSPSHDMTEKNTQDMTTPCLTLWIRSTPSLVFLIFLLFGNLLNKGTGIAFITPLTTLGTIAILTILCTKVSVNEMSVALIDNSRFVLMVLFAVGIFLGFLNIVGELGVFCHLASLAGMFPPRVCLAAAMILAFLIAIPAGAFCTAILLLVLPTFAALGLWSESLGLIAVAAALGAHLSPVQVNIGAFRDCFQMKQADAIHTNIPFMLGTLFLLIAVAQVCWGL